MDVSETATTRTTSKLDKQKFEDFQDTIAVFNDGKVKGRQSPAIEEAIQLWTVLAFAKRPSRLKNLEATVDIDDLNCDDFTGFRKRIIDYANATSGTVTESANQLSRDTPGAPTVLERYVNSNRNKEDGAPTTRKTQLQGSLVNDI